ncbi:hypothetical protein HY374_02095 [Candidatus Berkelbacteria bacterium]|nr:hypothetical protein [Candidatus Berkelbacteria bacterium]
MHLSEATFKWVEEIISNVLGVFGSDAIKKLVQSFMGVASEKTAEDYASWIEYRVTKRVPPLIYDIYQQTIAKIRTGWPLEADRVTRRLAALGNDEHQDHFIITVVQLPANAKDPKQWDKAVERTIDVMRDYARMDDQAWRDTINGLNINRAEKEKFFQRFLRQASRQRRKFVRTVKRVARELSHRLGRAGVVVDTETDRWAQNIDAWLQNSVLTISARQINQQRQSRPWWQRILGI